MKSCESDGPLLYSKCSPKQEPSNTRSFLWTLVCPQNPLSWEKAQIIFLFQKIVKQVKPEDPDSFWLTSYFWTNWPFLFCLHIIGALMLASGQVSQCEDKKLILHSHPHRPHCWLLLHHVVKLLGSMACLCYITCEPTTYLIKKCSV